ncbi:type I-E CRISPR-associated protein Cse2/CasB [Lysobacteraceae bacterium NML120232]|nr:type I-E CRISPR-associated protein Cse2/CasB [Xanthomonadaceae bacterium NML120232]PJK10985.1 type I-E CRISPR-associated protein Cse2/CasB [Xanthomonadaceae bacterium NML08-0793]
MSEHASAFVQHLQTLQEKKDLGALATLRRSLAFEPGSYPRAFPYVERFVGEAHERDARRLALYAVAGLFAAHPEPNAQSFATAFGRLARQRKVSTEREYSLSIERRFIALLEADADGIHIHMRHAISLLKAEGLGLDYAALLDDLSWWMNPNSNLDRVRQRWARDFYRATQAKADDDANNP